MRTALFWAITQRVVVISYRRFVTNYRSDIQGSTPEDWTRRVVPKRRWEITTIGCVIVQKSAVINLLFTLWIFWLRESVPLTHLQTFRFAPLVVLIWCSFRSYNLQYDNFVQKFGNILLPPSSGWLGFVKFFAEVLSGGTPSIVSILVNHYYR